MTHVYAYISRSNVRVPGDGYMNGGGNGHEKAMSMGAYLRLSCGGADLREAAIDDDSALYAFHRAEKHTNLGYGDKCTSPART